MKKFFKCLLVCLVCIVLVGCGCSKKNKKENGKENITDNRYHFDYDKEMFDNPSDWPKDEVFSGIPRVSDTVDDLSVVNYGGNKDVYTLTIVKMDYNTFKNYANRLMDKGFMCTKAGYWIPDKESDLPTDTSQCFADNDGVYIKAYWYKSSASSYNFQMSVAMFNMDTK